MVNDILELEDDLQRLIIALETKHGIGITQLTILRDDQSETPVGNLEVKAQWLVASKLDR